MPGRSLVMEAPRKRVNWHVPKLLHALVDDCRRRRRQSSTSNAIIWMLRYATAFNGVIQEGGTLLDRNGKHVDLRLPALTEPQRKPLDLQVGNSTLQAVEAYRTEYRLPSQTAAVIELIQLADLVDRTTREGGTILNVQGQKVVML